MNKLTNKLLVAVLTFSTTLTATSVLAYPLAPSQDLFQTTDLSNFTPGYNFAGIVALNNCSGALVRFENSKLSDKGMVLTNGHCLETGMPSPGTFVYGKASSRAFKLFDAAAKPVARLTATQVIYSTMTYTDITLYKINETYADIKSHTGIEPLVIDSHHPALAEPIEVISGYWVRGYACAIEAFIPKLSEAGWESQDSVRYSRPGCETIGGTSGSPIIRAGTRTVIGINNTGNEDGEKCTMNNPCEIDKDGKVSAHKGYSYGQQTYLIYSCLNSANEFDLSVPGCMLLH